MLGLKKYAVLPLSCLLASCALYQPKTLPTEFSLPNNVSHLVLDRAQAQSQGQTSSDATWSRISAQPHRLDLSAGLDMDQVAMLAVLNNPDIKLARDDAGVAHAQAFAAGLLPDPQLSLSRDLSNTGGPGSSKAFSAGLSYDLISIVTYGAVDAAAQAEIKKTDMNLLWQEWQLIAQARLAYVKLSFAKKAAALIETNRALFAKRVANSQQAFDKNYISNDAYLTDLTALQDLQRQSNDSERQVNQLQQELTTLLGLSPDAEVKLQEPNVASLIQLDESLIVRDAKQLAQRRPDLIALQSGFEAEDQRYRAALLSQFPSFNIGFTRARDSSSVYSNGVGVTLSLPLLNRNRGAIAVELATREKLINDYQQRLNAANSDIHKLLLDQTVNLRQLTEIQTALTQFNLMVTNADSAYANNAIDGLVVANAHSSLLAKQLEQLNLQQSIFEQRIALQLLLGGDVLVPPTPAQRSLENHSS